MDSAQLCIIKKTATFFMFLCQRMVNKVNIYYTPPIFQKCKGLDFNIFYLRIQKIKSHFGFISLLNRPNHSALMGKDSKIFDFIFNGLQLKFC